MKLNKPELAKQAVDSIENIAGTFPGYRRAHAKGVYYQAIFTPNGNAASYTTAAHLQKKEVKAVVRFSDSSPNPNMVDILSPVKGMSVQFQLPDGNVTNLVSVTVPVFITKTPEAFVEILRTLGDKSSLRDVVKIFVNYPESRAAFHIMKKLRPFISYTTSRYFPIHTFYFINEEGEQQAVKYEWEPDDQLSMTAKKEAVMHPGDYVDEELEKRLEEGPIGFDLNVWIGEDGDSVNDSTIMWPAERQKITIGHLSITNKLKNQADDIVFDPTVMTNGLACTDDPVLHFRRDVYSVSFDRRLKGK
jgi:catalase